MKKLLCIVCILVTLSSVSAQDIFGQWKTIDDKTGEAKSIIEIYKKDDKVFGKIVDILDKSKKELPCIKCSGSDYNKPILGLDIIKNMQKEGKYYKKGTIIDPQNGKVYKLRLNLADNNNDILQVRGYIGFFYATQYWERVTE
ncbi:DUF2147 domain-containing protein [Lacinutrix salivirga]